MSRAELSPSAKALLRAAKADVPSAAARAKIWGGVATTAKAGAGLAGLAGSKLLVLGTLFGSAMTVGLAAAMIHLGGATGANGSGAEAAPAPRVVMHAAAPRAERAPEAPPMSVSAPAVNDAPKAADAAKTKAKASAPAKVPAIAATPVPSEGASRAPGASTVVAVEEEDPLMREASLVAEARGALVRGDAAGALRAIQTAKALPARQLQPEELAVEAEALRALGRPAEAAQAGGALKTQYPDHALAH